MGGELRLRFTEEGADPERLDRFARPLRQEILQFDVDTVAGLPAGQAPPGGQGSR